MSGCFLNRHGFLVMATILLVPFTSKAAGRLDATNPVKFQKQAKGLVAEMKIYISPNGDHIACSDNIGDECFWSDDGENYYQMAQKGLNGSTVEYVATYGTASDIDLKVELKSDLMTIDCFGNKVELHRKSPKLPLSKAKFIPLPNALEPVFLAQSGNETVFVAGTKYISSHGDSRKLFVGGPGKWKEVKIKDESLVNGDWTFTDEFGRALFVPYPAETVIKVNGKNVLKPVGKATWNKQPALVNRKVSAKDIQELELKPLLTRAGVPRTICDRFTRTATEKLDNYSGDNPH